MEHLEHVASRRWRGVGDTQHQCVFGGTRAQFHVLLYLTQRLLESRSPVSEEWLSQHYVQMIEPAVGFRMVTLWTGAYPTGPHRR